MDLHEKISSTRKEIRDLCEQHRNLQCYFAEGGYYRPYFKVLLALALCGSTVWWGVAHSQPILIVQFVFCAAWLCGAFDQAVDVYRNRTRLRTCERDIKRVTAEHRFVTLRGLHRVFHSVIQDVPEEHSKLVAELRATLKTSDWN